MLNVNRFVSTLNLLVLCLMVPLLRAAEERRVTEKSATDHPPGIEKRIAWTTSHITGSPEPPLPYRAERFFSNLEFKNPVALTAAPGTDRLFLLELTGKVYSFENRRDVQKADLAIDLHETIKGADRAYALTFHPDFARNRYCYICYIVNSDKENGSRVSRFTASKTDPPVIDPKSEKSIVTWIPGGHNGCCLKFGLDGYLYISTGDGSAASPPDSLMAGQDVGNLLSSVLRIDVDREENGKAYAIPQDNPFVHLQGARPEVWAFGLRNPWRMSFDRKTGRLWLGDVGWELWEMVYHVRSGGNYGWSIMEGPQPVGTGSPYGPTPILPPTYQHPHSESSSVTGGYVYYGTRLPKLTGAYIYGDYDTGKVWALRYDGKKVTSHEDVADTTIRLVSFGLDHRDELYLVGHTDGLIYRLVPNPKTDSQNLFPHKLSETGLFTSVTDQTPAPGVIAYSINSPPWADGARAERFVALPGTTTMTVANQWEFPKDSVFAKTVSLEMQQGNPASSRRLETQILHYDGEAWQGYTYEWNDSQTDAELLGADGGRRTFEIQDASAPGGIRKQTWHFTSRVECMRCHNPWAGHVLAFNVPQLNREPIDGDRRENQLRRFAHLRLLDKDLSQGDAVPRLTDSRDETADISARARSYLHTNCAHCHRSNAGSAVLSKMRYDLELEKTTMLDVRPTQGTFALHAARVIAPGNPYSSVLWYRMSKLGRGRMPHIGSDRVDTAGADLIYRWISALPPAIVAGETGPTSPISFASGPLSVLRDKNSSAEARAAAIDRWLSSTGGALRALRAVDQKQLRDDVRKLVIDRAIAHADSQVRDLFERFVPEEQRVQRLGSVIRPEQILSLPGDADRGKQLFFNAAGVQCRNCHRIGKIGKEVGPHLDEIGKKNSPAQLLESILEPSKKINPKFVTHLLETKQGKIVSGLVMSKTAEEVVLRDAANKEIRLKTADVELLVPQQKSLMPELLLRDMTAQEVADLLAFLSMLK